MIALAFAGARQELHPLWLIGTGTVGSYLSLYLLYLAGRGPLRDRVRRWVNRGPGSLDRKIGGFYERWGYLVLLASRFLTGIRGPLTFLAGVYGLTPGRTALALLPACLAWNALVVAVGYGAGRYWDGTAGGLALVGLGLALSLVVVWLVGFGLIRLFSRPRTRRSPAG